MRRGWRARIVIAAAALSACAVSTRAGQTSVWTGSGGNWTDGFNWSTSPAYPNNGSIAFDAVLNNPNGSINLNSSVTVDSFNLATGTIGGNGQLNVGNLTWGEGAIQATGNISVNSNLIIGGNTRGFGGVTLTILPNAGATWSGWSIFSVAGEGGVVDNYGYFDDQTDGGWFWGTTQSPVFNNYGNYVKSNGFVGNYKSIWAAFNNSGTTDVQVGDLWLAGGGANSGTFTVQPGARLFFSDFNQMLGSSTTSFSNTASVYSLGTLFFPHPTVQNGGTDSSSVTSFAGTFDAVYTQFDTGQFGSFRFEPGSVIGSQLGGSDIELISGALRYDSGTTLSFNNGTVSGGELGGSDNLAFATLSWSGGAMTGVSTLSRQTTILNQLNISGDGDKSLSNRTLTLDLNSSTSIGGAGSIRLNSGTIVTAGNPAIPANLDLQDDVQFVNDGSIATSLFDNQGRFRKVGGIGSAVFDRVRFDNSGTTEVYIGTLRFAGGGNSSGTFFISANNALEFGSPQASVATYSLGSTSIISGPQNSLLTFTDNAVITARGTIDVDQVDLNAATINLNGGTISAGTLQLVGPSKIIVTPGSHGRIKAKTLSIDSGNGSNIDLGDGLAIIDYPTGGPSPLASIRQRIVTGDGITSSMVNSTSGLGYGDNAVLHATSFGGFSVDDSSVFVRYTYFGDANLDGRVDVKDLRALATHYNAADNLWTSGDFNYDGAVNMLDLNLLVHNWQLGVAGAPLGPSPTSVPEPSGLLGVALLALGGRRRRSSRQISP